MFFRRYYSVAKKLITAIVAIRFPVAVDLLTLHRIASSLVAITMPGQDEMWPPPGFPLTIWRGREAWSHLCHFLSLRPLYTHSAGVIEQRAN